MGIFTFYNSKNNRLRVSGLACLFPGAGFLAVGGFLGAIGLILSVAAVPLSLFAWFGAGGLAFILANWIIPGLVAAAIVGDRVWEPAAPIVIVTILASITYGLVISSKQQAEERRLQTSRNELLKKAEIELQNAPKTTDDTGVRELKKTELQQLQHFIEACFQQTGDWSNYTRIDQFQTSALRYQLYDLQWTMAYVQKYYMPNFHGYIKTAQERAIEKSTEQDVMGYWKWESLWGKFTFVRLYLPSCPSVLNKHRTGILSCVTTSWSQAIFFSVCLCTRSLPVTLATKKRIL